MGKKLVAILILFCCVNLVYSQDPCTADGQRPTVANDVCGTAQFQQSTVPICVNRAIPGPCSAIVLNDKNPYWYKFTCFRTGTLGFQIVPNIITDDYDWQLFDITNRNPDEVYTDPRLFVACNWSGEGGITGASAAGKDSINCDGFGVPLFNRMPTLQTGHTYLLMVSHFTDSQGGYSLGFGGGTASITDSTQPHLQSVTSTCAADKIFVKLNKKDALQ